MPAVIQRLKADQKRYILVTSSPKESEALARLQKEQAKGNYAFVETTQAIYADAKKRHNRYNVWVRLG